MSLRCDSRQIGIYEGVKRAEEVKRCKACGKPATVFKEGDWFCEFCGESGEMVKK